MIGILAVLSVSWPAAAQRDDRRMPPPAKDTQAPGSSTQGQRMPGREEPDERQTHRRMTPEERQQLRRDINDHGREIYRPAPKNTRP